MSNGSGSAPCPTETPPSSDPPTSTVVVSILSLEPNTDFEGDDDYVPFYDNRADFYGFVNIDGEEFNLPMINETDFPHWGQEGVFRKVVSNSTVPIRIDIWEGDEVLTGTDDQVDICPLPDKAHLDVLFDLCSLELSGDIATQSTQAGNGIAATGGPDDDDATIRFTVRLEDGRPVSQDDLALVEVDLVQVRHATPRLVARRPTVVMARLANNFSVDVATELRLQIAGGGIAIDDTFVVDLQAGEVKKIYLYDTAPIRFPASLLPYDVAIVASITDPGSAGLPMDDCRRSNDSTPARMLWKVVTTENVSFLWVKVGTLFDVGNYTSDAHFAEIKELGHAYIQGLFPVIGAVADESPIPLSPPTSAALDFLVTVLSSFGIPASILEPFALVFELNALAAIAGYDRLMGVLPNHDWFERFDYLERITGLSLGEYAPHAVIFLPREKSDDGLEVGPQMTLPAHELGHTYGLSTDSSLKDDWRCGFPWPVVGLLPCGAAGGFDEYDLDDPSKKGNPASGFWVAQGDEPPAVIGLINREQCDSRCVMGNSPRNAHVGANWEQRGRWIDAADYDHLLDKLGLVSDPEVVFVSGMIAWRDEMYVGPIYHVANGRPDRDRSFGLYAVRFEGQGREVLAEYGLPINWNTPEYRRPMPISFFGLWLPFPDRSEWIVFMNRGTGRVLAEVRVSRHAPTVRITRPRRDQRLQAGAPIQVRWEARDEDDDPLSYSVLMGHDGSTWWPVARGLTARHFELSTGSLRPGTYFLRVQAHDGVHLGDSQPVAVRLEAPPG